MDGWSYIEERISADLKNLELAGRLRSLLSATSSDRIGAPLIDLTHNDYLGLKSDLEFRGRGLEMAQQIEFGSGGSRLLGGNHPIFSRLESKFSEFKSCAASLYFSSGFLANVGLITTLARLDGRFFSDQLNHASIIDGLKLAGVPRADREIYNHLDLVDLELRLQRSQSPVNFIVTESVFSMDGDVADLGELHRLAQKYHGVLIVDEAHAVGCFGAGGSGMISAQALDHTQIISVNACGKALGAQGALVSGPSWLIDALINYARTFIYSTAPSPFIAGIALAAISYISTLDERRIALADKSRDLRLELQAHGIDTGNSKTHIFPLILGSDQKALSMSAQLLERGILARAIRPPTVAEGQSRVRVSLNSGLSRADMVRVARAIL